MTKKELEEQLKIMQVDLKYLDDHMTKASSRIQENIKLIEGTLKTEKNKEKRKLLGGLLNEFQYILNLLELNDLPF